MSRILRIGQTQRRQAGKTTGTIGFQTACRYGQAAVLTKGRLKARQEYYP
ncbi:MULTISPECIES: hypothetical protein [Neisseria]|nr:MULTISPECIES: hypothetical protein [Neisseria]MBF0804431.1 hypothetical protein [Neisseria sp. 19428wB4_WF04]